MDRWRTPFGAWVRAYGAKRLGLALGLSGPFPVYEWIGGRCMPRPAHALQIVALSGARLNLGDIYAQRYAVAGREAGRPDRKT